MNNCLTSVKRYSWIIVVTGILSYLFIHYNFLRLVFHSGYYSSSIVTGILSLSFGLSAIFMLAVWFIYAFICFLGANIVDSSKNIKYADLLSGIGIGAIALVLVSVIDGYLFFEIEKSLPLYELETSFTDGVQHLTSHHNLKIVGVINKGLTLLLLLWSVFVVWLHNNKDLANAVLSIMLPLFVIVVTITFIRIV